MVNFVFPYIVISDIWKASRPGGRAVTDLSAQRPSRLVIGWWAVILIAALLNLTHRWLSSDEGATLESVHTLAVVDTVQCGFLALSAAGIISIIWRITSWQIATLPAPRKISARRGEAEARINFIVFWVKHTTAKCQPQPVH